MSTNEVNVDPDHLKQQFSNLAAAHGLSEIEVDAASEGPVPVDQVKREPEIDSGQVEPTREFFGELFPEAAADYLPGLELTEEEIRKAANAYGDLIDKYFPGGWMQFFEKYKIEVTAVWVTYRIAKPRLAKRKAGPGEGTEKSGAPISGTRVEETASAES